jgi:hypothetical protein
MIAQEGGVVVDIVLNIGSLSDCEFIVVLLDL